MSGGPETPVDGLHVVPVAIPHSQTCGVSDCVARGVLRIAERKLSKAQDIPVGIFEPSDFGAGWRSPDAQIILLYFAEALEANAGFRQFPNRGADAGNLPPKHGSLRGRKFLAHAEPDHNTVGFKNDREWRLLGQQA